MSRDLGDWLHFDRWAEDRPPAPVPSGPPTPLARRLCADLIGIVESVGQLADAMAATSRSAAEMSAVCEAIIDRCRDLELVAEDVAALETPESPEYQARLADQDARAAREAWRGRPFA